MSGHPVLPGKYSIVWNFYLSKLAQIVSIGPGIRPQKGQRDNFTREPPCLQESILGVPAVCMKPSITCVFFQRLAVTVVSVWRCQNGGFSRRRWPEKSLVRWKRLVIWGNGPYPNVKWWRFVTWDSNLSPHWEKIWVFFNGKILIRWSVGEGKCWRSFIAKNVEVSRKVFGLKGLKVIVIRADQAARWPKVLRFFEWLTHRPQP